MTLSHQQKIVLASGNAGKIREIQAIFEQHPIVPQSEFNVPDIEETGSTFVENAIIKARNAALHCKLPAIADDSGLVVDALNGAPGVYSARYAGVGASDAENNEKLLLDLNDVPDHERTARFICVMVFMKHADDPLPIIVQGIWEGYILTKAIGSNGFGYDPLFFVPEYGLSSAELEPDVKNALSHRGKALQQLADAIKTRESVR
ncbi:XTP/dITP diphosphohydrolase [Patescibacteria group bacterium]|nr:XTP/dITP diphosphohydrolase [Patescibacteria group bacterium]